MNSGPHTSSPRAHPIPISLPALVPPEIGHFEPRLSRRITFVVAGANGDLAGMGHFLRPALLNLVDPEHPMIALLGGGMTREQYLELVRVGRGDGIVLDHQFATFDSALTIRDVDLTRPESLNFLRHVEGDVLLYAAVPPGLFMPLLGVLQGLGVHERSSESFRIVIEKPLGSSPAAASELAREIRKFRSGQVLMMDHFLAEPPLLTCMALRSNSWFDELLCGDYVDRVEGIFYEVGLDGLMGRQYFRKTGLIVDGVQNHLLQMVAAVATERPRGEFEPDRLCVERARLFDNIVVDPSSVVLAQYAGFNAPGLSSSKAETYVRFDFRVRNTPRWKGVPFELRASKAAAVTRYAVDLHLKGLPVAFAENLDVSPRTSGMLSLEVGSNAGVWLVLHPLGERKTFELKPEPPVGDVHQYTRILEGATRAEKNGWLFPSLEEHLAAWRAVEGVGGTWENKPTPLPRYPPGTPAEKIESLLKWPSRVGPEHPR